MEIGYFLQESCVVEALQEFPPCRRAVLLAVLPFSCCDPQWRLLIHQEWLMGPKRLLSLGWWQFALGIATMQNLAA